ncbi:cation-translocating P-type ATPase [soil metagenome]
MSAECCGTDDRAASADGQQDEEALSVWHVREVQAALAAAVLLAVGFAAGRAGADGLEGAATVLALVVGGSTFVPSSLRALSKGRVGVGLLMTVAAVGAVALGQLTEAALLTVLFSGSEGLEEYSMARTRRGLRALLSLVPDEVRVLRSGTEQTIAASALAVGDVMVVRPGERVATDAVVTAGRSAVDLAALTGESVPVEVTVGDTVPAAAINGTGPLEARATATVEDNSLARIVKIVEEEQARKGASQRLADRVARPLVPAIVILSLAIAGLGALLGDPGLWVGRALVVLVAASPCALAISVPVTAVTAIGAASRLGVLIKGGAALEDLGTVTTIALDKTGTLTANRPRVVDTLAVEGVTTSDVLAVAAGLEARSEHPLARAVLAAGPTEPMRIDDVATVTGAGITGRLAGASVRLGRPGWIDPGPLVDEVERLQGAGATVVLVERDQRLLGAIAVRDELRPEAAQVVRDLTGRGLRVVMLTGDNRRTAAAVAAEAGIAEVHADLRPEDKATIIGELGTDVAMVGDGVNDAPALATARVGIAMAAMGTDVAIETADVALMGEDLRHLPRVLAHARRSHRIMRQNIGLSLLIVVALVPLAIFGALGLAAIVAVHELAEIVVIGNGLRAGRTDTSTLEPMTPTKVTGLSIGQRASA